MTHPISLEAYLAGWCKAGAGERRAVAATLLELADAARAIAELAARGPLAGRLEQTVGHNAQGEAQKKLDMQANDIVLAALARAPVAVAASEELDTAVVLAEGAPLGVAFDPLDGSSNIVNNVSIGTIFSVLEADKAVAADPDRAFLRQGRVQQAAGYVIYGPHCALVLTVGQGTQVYTLDRRTGAFLLTCGRVSLPARTREYAINASNARHWNAEIRAYVADCVAGRDGPREEDCNTRWVASLVAEAHRIISRGGVFLYPADARKGYCQGHLRLIYEANPVAWLIEQAGGSATDGYRRILDLMPERLHQRTPFVFGSHEEVARVARYQSPRGAVERSPLFNERGLFGAQR
jgi:fructose-1,6-bisphosphatase I